MNRYVVAFIDLVLIFSVVSVSCFLYNNTSDVLGNDVKSPTVIIDAGHGGKDAGAFRGNLLEKNVTLKVAKKVNELLKNKFPDKKIGLVDEVINLSISFYLTEILRCYGYNVIMTRSTDEQIGDNSLTTIRQRKISDVRKRLELTKLYPDSLFVSIHQNHYSSPRYSGAQVFYSPKSSLSKLLAETVQGSLVSLIQKDNTRMIKEIGTNVYLLYNCECPAVMVECGFLSNPDESKLLATTDYQKKIAFSVACGIIKFLEDENG